MPKDPNPLPKPKRMMRCLAGVSIHLVGTDTTEHFWPGLEVDFDRELKPATPTTPAYTVADAVAGRDQCFEPVTTAPGAGKE